MGTLTDKMVGISIVCGDKVIAKDEKGGIEMGDREGKSE